MKFFCSPLKFIQNAPVPKSLSYKSIFSFLVCSAFCFAEFGCHKPVRMKAKSRDKAEEMGKPGASECNSMDAVVESLIKEKGLKKEEIRLVSMPTFVNDAGVLNEHFVSLITKGEQPTPAPAQAPAPSTLIGLNDSQADEPTQPVPYPQLPLEPEPGSPTPAPTPTPTPAPVPAPAPPTPEPSPTPAPPMPSPAPAPVPPTPNPEPVPAPVPPKDPQKKPRKPKPAPSEPAPSPVPAPNPGPTPAPGTPAPTPNPPPAPTPGPGDEKPSPGPAPTHLINSYVDLSNCKVTHLENLSLDDKDRGATPIPCEADKNPILVGEESGRGKKHRRLLHRTFVGEQRGTYEKMWNTPLYEIYTVDLRKRGDAFNVSLHLFTKEKCELVLQLRSKAQPHSKDPAKKERKKRNKGDKKGDQSGK